MLESLDDYADEMMLMLCRWANSDEGIPKKLLNRNQVVEVRKWLDAMAWDVEQGRSVGWESMRKNERRDVLEELADCVTFVRFAIRVGDEREEGIGAEHLVETMVRKFGFKDGARLRRRVPKKIGYVSEDISYELRGPRTDGFVIAALFVLWLLDRPLKRAKLRRCADPECAKLFWSSGATKKHRFCPGAGCKGRFEQKKHYDKVKRLRR